MSERRRRDIFDTVNDIVAHLISVEYEFAIACGCVAGIAIAAHAEKRYRIHVLRMDAVGKVLGTAAVLQPGVAELAVLHPHRDAVAGGDDGVKLGLGLLLPYRRSVDVLSQMVGVAGIATTILCMYRLPVETGIRNAERERAGLIRANLIRILPCCGANDETDAQDDNCAQCN